MATLEYFLMTESYSVDQSSNRVSLFNVLEDVGGPNFPVEFAEIVAVSSWIVPPEEQALPLEITLRLHPPDGKEPQDFPMKLEPGNAARRRSFISLIGFRFRLVGDWRFEMLLAGRHQANHIVTVVQPEPGGPGPGAAARPGG